MRTLDLSAGPESLSKTAVGPSHGQREGQNAIGRESYRRSLLRIRLPIAVTLAQKKESVGRIVEIVPGSIIEFDRSCDAPLELTAGSRTLAQGECVQVGDRWGLQISRISPPDQRSRPVAENEA